MLIREFRVGDEPALHQVFLSAVHESAIKDYTPEQVSAWAPKTVDADQWADRMRAIRPFVAVHDGLPVAYADLQPNGYIDHFFVSYPFARQGIGSGLMRKIHAAAAEKKISVLTSEVSRAAQPLFQYFGFVVVEEREPVIAGVAVPNVLMKKQLL